MLAASDSIRGRVYSLGQRMTLTGPNPHGQVRVVPRNTRSPHLLLQQKAYVRRLSPVVAKSAR